VQVMASAECREYLDAFDRLVRELADPRRSRTGVQRLWTELVEGGWFNVGSDVGGSSLVDLCEFAWIWGHYFPAAPFIPTLIGRSADSTEVRAFTVVVPGRGEAITPFAAWTDVVRLGAVGDSGAEEIDEFDPSLGICRAPNGNSELDASVARSLATLWASEALGAAAQAFTEVVSYAKERFAYGRAIGSFQAVAHMLAEMHRDLEVGKSAVICSTSNGGEWSEAVCFASENAVNVLRRVIQVYGGIGFTWELGVHWNLRHAMQLDELIQLLSEYAR
jgi:hypothetical protein